MTILVTGAAGFIGRHACARLLAAGRRVVGLDNLNPYYDPALKRDRLASLAGLGDFSFHRLDLADHAAVADLARAERPRTILHLAAQAGVRYSLQDPFAYAQSNLTGHLSVLEAARALGGGLEHLVYASSSSVYGNRAEGPFKETDPVDAPASLYAATKRADELMSATYARLYTLPITGLRFFTVYGPWGRPDMAYWMFTQKILAGEPIDVFNEGRLKRDFTFIDDIVSGVDAVLKSPAARGEHRLYNIGNNDPVELLDFIAALERATGRKAIKVMKPMQPGDVLSTFADISAMKRDFGWAPTTRLADGLPVFVDWYRERTSTHAHAPGAGSI